jgi:hypothetical protein
MHLGAVGGDVVKLPAAGMFRDEFPVAHSDRTIAFMFPKNRLRAIERFPGEGRRKAHAFQRLNLLTGEFRRIFRPREVQARRHDVD